MGATYEWGNLAHPFHGFAFVDDGECARTHDRGDEPIGGPVESGCGDECLVTGGAIVLSFDEVMVIEGSHDQLRALAVRILAAVPDPNPTGTLLRHADQSRVAVSWQDRTTVEATLDCEFTDDEWDKVWPHLDNYDECFDSGYGVPDAVVEWMRDALRAAGVRRVGEYAACRHCSLDLEWNGTVWWDRGRNTRGLVSDVEHVHEPHLDL